MSCLTLSMLLFFVGSFVHWLFVASIKTLCKQSACRAGAVSACRSGSEQCRVLEEGRGRGRSQGNGSGRLTCSALRRRRCTSLRSELPPATKCRADRPTDRPPLPNDNHRPDLKLNSADHWTRLRPIPETVRPDYRLML